MLKMMEFFAWVMMITGRISITIAVVIIKISISIVMCRWRNRARVSMLSLIWNRQRARISQCIRGIRDCFRIMNLLGFHSCCWRKRGISMCARKTGEAQNIQKKTKFGLMTMHSWLWILATMFWELNLTGKIKPSHLT